MSFCLSIPMATTLRLTFILTSYSKYFLNDLPDNRLLLCGCTNASLILSVPCLIISWIYNTFKALHLDYRHFPRQGRRAGTSWFLPRIHSCAYHTVSYTPAAWKWSRYTLFPKTCQPISYKTEKWRNANLFTSRCIPQPSPIPNHLFCLSPTPALTCPFFYLTAEVCLNEPPTSFSSLEIAWQVRWSQFSFAFSCFAARASAGGGCSGKSAYVGVSLFAENISLVVTKTLLMLVASAAAPL